LNAGLSAECNIAVVERQQRVVWDENGRLWWIDAEGVIFSAQPPRLAEGSEGWLVQGPLPRDKNGRLDKRASVALNELWEAGANISPLLQYVPGRGFVLTDERGWRVIVGQGSGMAKRLRVLEWLAADLETRGLTPRFVDVRFPDAPYYSLTNDW
jgi:cell division septal protein FtsQ